MREIENSDGLTLKNLWYEDNSALYFVKKSYNGTPSKEQGASVNYLVLNKSRELNASSTLRDVRALKIEAKKIEKGVLPFDSLPLFGGELDDRN
jgi:hypothetical protein